MSVPVTLSGLRLVDCAISKGLARLAELALPSSIVQRPVATQS